jgi:putative DNA modification/repair radical SAM protein
LDIRHKLRILADAAKYDASCASSGSRRKTLEGGIGNTEGMGICHSYTPDGRCVSLLKLLLTNYCVYDCLYCVNRISSDTPRARFTPEEVVFLTMEFYRRNYIEGLFLSSGVIQSADYTMQEMIRAVKLLRTEHKFGGYIHVKAVPGASRELVAEAGLWADRLSANIELPRDSDLVRLAPAKNHAEIETSMQQIRGGIDQAKEGGPAFAPAGQSTQMIVGAAGETDDVIIDTAARLYRRHRLRRVYYSGYSPIPHPDPNLPAARPPLVREHRLYQADWLMRFYGFEPAEILEGSGRNLALDKDPKLAWALRHREFFPVDINAAPREALLRIPGVGVRNVKRILKARCHRRLSLDDVRRLGAAVERAKFFFVAEGHNPDANAIDSPKLPGKFTPEPQQLLLFETRTGEL